MKEPEIIISVVICTYNRGHSLKDTLDSLLIQKLDSTLKCEIIVVDNNSSDNTREVVESYYSKFNNNLKYVFEVIQGLSNARNRGIIESIGEIIAFTDDDVIVENCWLKNIADCYQEHEFDAAGGRILPLYPEDAPKWIKENRDFLSGPIVSYDYGNHILLHDNKMNAFVGANMIFKRNCLRDFRFNPNMGIGNGMMGEDTDLFYRLKRSNKKIYYFGSVLVWHKVDKTRTNYRYFAKWYIASGKYWATSGEENLSSDTAYCFGVPRYLIKKIALNSICCLGAYLYSKKRFLKLWKAVFVDIGRLLAYRKINKCQKLAS